MPEDEMDSIASDSRPTIAWMALPVLLALSAGCLGTSMTARYARVPVMVGPVSCIGCKAELSPAASPLAPIADNAHRSGGYIVLPWLGETDFAVDRPPQIDLKLDSAISDPCKAEVRISKLKASSFGVVALVYALSQEDVDLAGATFLVANGTCGPRLWPYSGPRGIVVFEPTSLKQGPVVGGALPSGSP